MKLLKYNRSMLILISLSLIFAFGVITSVAQEKQIRDFFEKKVMPSAGAESMNFKLVSMIEKREMVKVTQVEGIIIGVLDRKGLSIFDNGEVATTSCRGTFDTKKGVQGYSSIIFEDGSTLVLYWKGPAIKPPPAGGKFREYKLAVEYVDGTGRFKGVKGNGTYTAKEPQWDEDYKAKGFAYYQFAGTYTLTSK